MPRQTPGRWSIRAKGFKVDILDYDSRMVANMESDEFSFDEAMDDARLIVNCPELMDQLSILVKCMNDVRKRGALTPREISLVQVAADLITKTKGDL